MSKETEPIRSRRELREQSVQSAGSGASPTDPATSAQTTTPAQPAAAQAAPRGERESQIRARDRAALRAYQELIDPPAMNPLPSRRALRQAQLDAERAPITSVTPVVPVASAPTPPAVVKAPAVKPAAPVDPAQAADRDAAGETPAAAPADAAPANAAPATTSAPATKTAAPAVHPAPHTRSGRRAATVAEPSGQTGPVDTHHAVHAAPAEAPLDSTTDDAAEASQQHQVAPPTADVDKNYPPMPGLVPGGSYYPVTAGPPPEVSEEDLQLLAAQKAEAERAAILSQRAQARERLAQESAKSKRQTSDPTATDNLAMVTPLEFIEVPGSNRPVMRPPATTHVPIVTRATPRQVPPRPKPPTPQPASAKPDTVGQNRPAPVEAATQEPEHSATAQETGVPSVSAERFDAALAARAAHRPGPGNRPLTGGRSSTLKKAEAMATGGHPMVDPSAVGAVEVQRSQMPPMPADYAHGLEPLDAVTAGLGRTQRNMLIQWGSVLVCGIALIIVAIMFFTP